MARSRLSNMSLLLLYLPFLGIFASTRQTLQAHALTFFDEDFETVSREPWMTTTNQLLQNSQHSEEAFLRKKGSQDEESSTVLITLDDLPRPCAKLIDRSEYLTRECLAWFTDSGVPLPAAAVLPPPPTLSPIPHFESDIAAMRSIDGTTRVNVTLSPADDTFIEKWRPDIPLGDREKMKIDSMDGLPTKIIMMKFYVGQTLQQLSEEYGGANNVSLISAKLRLFPITNTTFGGWVQQMKTDWEEETAIWNDYLEGGKNGNENEHLLPYNNERDVLGQFGEVLAEEWVEVDLTAGLIGIIENAGSSVGVGVGAGVAADDGDVNNISNGGNALALRITTDDTDGVIYLSKEASGERGPQLVLQFSVGEESQGANNNDGSDDDGETVNGNSTALEGRVPSAYPTVAITYGPTTVTPTTPKPTEFVTSAISTGSPMVAINTSTTISSTTNSSTTTIVQFVKSDAPTTTPTYATTIANSDDSTLTPTETSTSNKPTAGPTGVPTVVPPTFPTVISQKDTDAPTMAVEIISTESPTASRSGIEIDVPTIAPIEISFTTSPATTNIGSESNFPTMIPVDIASTASPSPFNSIPSTDEPTEQSTSTFTTDAPTTYGKFHAVLQKILV